MQWGSAAVGQVVATVQRRAEANAALQERVLLQQQQRQQQGSGVNGAGVGRQQQQQAAGEHLVTMWQQGAACEGAPGHSRGRGAVGPRHGTGNNSAKANGSYYYGGNYY